MAYNPLTGVLTLSSGLRVPTRTSQGRNVDEKIDKLTDEMEQGSTGLIGGIFNALDLPGSIVRDITAGENPIDQLLSPFSSKNRTSYIPKDAGLTDPSFYGGLALEIATDPLTWMTGGIGAAKTLVGKAAAKLGYVDDIVKAGSKVGKGKHASLFSATVGDLAADQQKTLASRMKRTLDDTFRSERLASGFGARAPYIHKNYGFGEKSLRQMERMDALGAGIRGSALGVAAHKLFAPLSKDFDNVMAQFFGSDATKAMRASNVVARGATAAFKNIFDTDVIYDVAGKSFHDADTAIGNAALDLGFMEGILEPGIKKGREKGAILHGTKVSSLPMEQQEAIANRLGKSVEDIAGERLAKTSFEPGLTGPRKLTMKEVGSFIEHPDTVPRDFPPEFREGIDNLHVFQKKFTEIKDHWGVKTVRLQDETGLEYMARGATLENYGKDIQAAMGEYVDWKSEAFDANNITRVGPFRDIAGGRTTIMNIISDDGIKDAIANAGNNAKALEDVANIIRKQYGHTMTKMFKSTKPSNLGKKYNRADAIAKIVTKLTPAERMAGLFGNDVMFDFEHRLANMLAITSLTKQSVEWMADHAYLAGGEAGVVNIGAHALKGARDKNDTTITKLLELIGIRPGGGKAVGDFNEKLGKVSQLPEHGTGRALSAQFEDVATGDLAGLSDNATAAAEDVVRPSAPIETNYRGEGGAARATVEPAPVSAEKVTGPVVRIGGKTYRGQTHFEALEKAVADGSISDDVIDLPVYMHMDDYGKFLTKPGDGIDLFETSEGKLIGREDAFRKFGGRYAEDYPRPTTKAPPTGAVPARTAPVSLTKAELTSLNIQLNKKTGLYETRVPLGGSTVGLNKFNQGGQKVYAQTQEEFIKSSGGSRKITKAQRDSAIYVHEQETRRAHEIGHKLPDESYAKYGITVDETPDKIGLSETRTGTYKDKYGYDVSHPLTRDALAEGGSAKLGRIAKNAEDVGQGDVIHADQLTGGIRLDEPQAVDGALDRLMERFPKELQDQIEATFDPDAVFNDAMALAKTDSSLGNYSELKKLNSELDALKSADAEGLRLIIDPEKKAAWLAEKKIKHIREVSGNLKVPRDLAKAISTMHGSFNDPIAAKEMQTWLGSFTNWFKATVTVPWLNFNVRNVSSAQFVHILAGHYTKSAFGTVMNVDDFFRGKTKVIKIAKTLPEVLDELKVRKWDVTDENATTVVIQRLYALETAHTNFDDVAAQLEIEKGISGMSSGGSDPMDIGGKVTPNVVRMPGETQTSSLGKILRTFFNMEPGTKMGLKNIRGVGDTKVTTQPMVAAGEQLTARAELINRVPAWLELQKQGYSSQVASDMVKASQVDYGLDNFTKFERDWMKKIFPFYAWQSRMIPFTLQALVEKPQLRAAVRGEQRASESNEGFVPERFRRQPHALLGGVSDRGYQEVLSGLDLAHNAALEPFQFGPTLGGSLKRLGQGIGGSTHPLLKLAIEQGTGTSLFNGRNLEGVEGGFSTIAKNVGAKFGVDVPKLPQPIDNVLLSALGGSRIAAPLRSLTDPRLDSNTERILKTAGNFLTGAKISTFDPEQERTNAFKDYLKEVGRAGRDLGTYERLFIPQSRLDRADPQMVDNVDAFNAQSERSKESNKQRDLLDLQMGIRKGIQQATGR